MAEDPKYPSLASAGVVGRAQAGRTKQIDDAESAALGKPPAPVATPPAPPAPVTPTAPSTGSSPSLMERVKNLVGLQQGGKVPSYKPGGKIPGKGKGDTVPIMATPGEFMVRKAAVPRANAAAKKAGYASLDHLNRGGNPDNRVPRGAKHRAGTRGMPAMKCGGKVK
jgi:hypothetical protein